MKEVDFRKDETGLNLFDRHVIGAQSARNKAANEALMDYLAQEIPDENVFMVSDASWGIRAVAKTMSDLLRVMREYIIPLDLRLREREYDSQTWEPIAMQKLEELKNQEPQLDLPIKLIISDNTHFGWNYSIRQVTGEVFRKAVAGKIAKIEYDEKQHPSGSDD